MEGLAPPLKLVLVLRNGIESGDSIRISVQKYLLSEDDDFARLVATWLARRDHGQSLGNALHELKSPFRQSAMLLLECGLKGESIYQQVLQLEEEILEASTSELDTFISVLPIKMLIPLLLLQFPAFLLVLFGPLLEQLLKSF
jgi:hypothetical protein